MTWIFFDASALVKRYSVEDGTLLINEMFDRIPINYLTCASIGVLEIVSVLVRKHNDNRLSDKLFAQAILEFNQEIIDRTYAVQNFLPPLIPDKETAPRPAGREIDKSSPQRGELEGGDVSPTA